MRSYAKHLPDGRTRTVTLDAEDGMVTEAVSLGHGCWPYRHPTSTPHGTVRQMAEGLRRDGYTRQRSR